MRDRLSVASSEISVITWLEYLRRFDKQPSQQLVLWVIGEDGGRETNHCSDLPDVFPGMEIQGCGAYIPIGLPEVPSASPID